MATFLRDLSYRHQWLYDGISRVTTLAVGGESRFRQMALEGLKMTPELRVLDLCCGSGQTTAYLVQHSSQVTGLDASPRSIERAQKNVPQAKFVEAWAEAMPFADGSFDLVHTSAALHEMKPQQLQQILQEAYRVLRPGGVLAAIDFHQPTQPLMLPGIALFFWLFETETAWQLLHTNLPQLLQTVGFDPVVQALHAGGSVQVLQAHKPALLV